jgi:glycosyltransferase involved in cell wall biosynthesis
VRPLKIYSSVPTDWNASNWYRTILPFRTAAEQGWAHVVVDQFDRVFPGCDKFRHDAIVYADIVQHYQNHGTGFEFSVNASKSMNTYWEDEENWNTPGHLVMDTDDDLFNVLPLNLAYQGLGIKLPNGENVKKNHYVKVIDELNNEKILYTDGKDGFDVESNMHRLNQFRANLTVAGLVTCSTPRVADMVLREKKKLEKDTQLYDNLHVFPNCVDFYDYPTVELADISPRVRILWQGGTSHHEDLAPLRPAFERIMEKYKHVEFVMWGAPYTFFLRNLDPTRVKLLPWVDYRQYKERLSMINHDINLAPLHPHIFNQSRSAIKWYESSAISKPAATLAQTTGAYPDEIEEGKTGLLFSTEEEFETKLSGLIEDASLRRTLASNAKDWVRTNRDPKVHVERLMEAYTRIREGRRAVMSPPPKVIQNGVVPEEQPDVREREDVCSGAVEQTVNH